MTLTRIKIEDLTFIAEKYHSVSCAHLNRLHDLDSFHAVFDPHQVLELLCAIDGLRNELVRHQMTSCMAIDPRVEWREPQRTPADE